MPTHFRGTEEEILALDTFIKLTRSVNAVQAGLIPLLQRDHSMTESQFAVLEALFHLGPLSPGQICQKILRSGSNVTTVLDNLERNGLVRRERDVRDRRVQIVQMTEAGRSAISAALPMHVERVTALMGALSEYERRELGRLCKKLGTSAASA